MTARPRSRTTDRIGDVVGITASVIGTIALHLFLFGGDRYFALRFLVLPVDNPISFTAFIVTLVLLVVAIVRASRARSWSVLRDAGADAAGAVVDKGADPVAGVDPVAEISLPAVAIPGSVTRRALRAAAMIAVLNALFMIVFPIAVIPMFLVIFLIAAALIAAVHIVLRAVTTGESGR